jgi:hypothetical protein
MLSAVTSRAVGRSEAAGATTKLLPSKPPPPPGPDHAGCPIHRAASCARGGLNSAEGRSEAATGVPGRRSLPAGVGRRNDPNCFPRCAHTVAPPRAKPPIVRAGPQNLSSPLAAQNPPKPPSPLAIYISKTWHSYPLPLDTIEIAPESKHIPIAPLPSRALRPVQLSPLEWHTMPPKRLAMSGLHTIFWQPGGYFAT